MMVVVDIRFKNLDHCAKFLYIRNTKFNA
jgi:hypothetical protein